MIFPFTFTLSKKIKGEIEKYSSKEILNHVSKIFKESDADHVKMIDNSVIVKNNVFNFFIIKRGGNTNRWGGISEAKFKITENENTRKVFYTINLTRILVVGLITGIVGLFLGNYMIGLFVFLFIGGLNWLIKIIQHLVIFSDILNDID